MLKQFICKNNSYQCACDCAQLCYTIQHRTVLIIFPLNFQAIIIPQTSNGGEESTKDKEPSAMFLENSWTTNVTSLY